MGIIYTPIPPKKERLKRKTIIFQGAKLVKLSIFDAHVFW